MKTGLSAKKSKIELSVKMCAMCQAQYTEKRVICKYHFLRGSNSSRKNAHGSTPLPQ